MNTIEDTLARIKSKHVPIDPSIPRRKIGPGEYLHLLAAENPTVLDCDLMEPPPAVLDENFLKNLVNVQPIKKESSILEFLKGCRNAND